MVGVLIDALGLGLGLSMDAAAVSMTNGMSEPGMRRGKAVLIAAFYGVFQGLMPLIGYLAGSLFTDVLSGITPYLALVILGFLGSHPQRPGRRQTDRRGRALRDPWHRIAGHIQHGADGGVQRPSHGQPFGGHCGGGP